MAIPASTAATPRIWPVAAGSPRTSQPAAAPTTGSRFTNAPASSAGTRAWPNANSQNGSGVPASARAASASAGNGAPGPCGIPSARTATGSATSAPPANWTAVSAAASRPASSRGWSAMNAADRSTEPSTSRSPGAVAPPPAAPATKAIPTSATPYPAQMRGRVALSPSPAASTATRTGTAPTTIAAWLTLVRSMPAFWSTITAPNPIAPEASMRMLSASRRPRRPTRPSTGAATAKRTTVSHPGPSHASASFVNGTFKPHRVPAAARARIADRLVWVFTPTGSVNPRRSTARFDISAAKR